MSLPTQCPASDEHVSAAAARTSMSCRHLKHACQDEGPPQQSHQEVKYDRSFFFQEGGREVGH